MDNYSRQLIERAIEQTDRQLDALASIEMPTEAEADFIFALQAIRLQYEALLGSLTAEVLR